MTDERRRGTNPPSPDANRNAAADANNSAPDDLSADISDIGRDSSSRADLLTEGEGTGTAYRAGFACLVGRPNAGKSTLTNALVGEKVAITSSKPQTTRHTIRGIAMSPGAQLVLVDTPGLHKPRTLLGQRLNDLVRETLLEVDVIGFCLPADQRPGQRQR